MTGKAGFSTTVVLVTIMDRGSQSRNFRSLMSVVWQWAAGGRMAQVIQHKALKRLTMLALRGAVRRRADESAQMIAGLSTRCNRRAPAKFTCRPGYNPLQNMLFAAIAWGCCAPVYSPIAQW